VGEVVGVSVRVGEVVGEAGMGVEVGTGDGVSVGVVGPAGGARRMAINPAQ
jgi:hypothetical protein